MDEIHKFIYDFEQQGSFVVMKYVSIVYYHDIRLNYSIMTLDEFIDGKWNILASCKKMSKKEISVIKGFVELVKNLKNS